MREYGQGSIRAHYNYVVDPISDHAWWLVEALNHEMITMLYTIRDLDEWYDRLHMFHELMTSKHQIDNYVNDNFFCIGTSAIVINEDDWI